MAPIGSFGACGRIFIATVLIAGVARSARVSAEDIDETALFSDTSSITDSASIVKSAGISSKAESTTVTFSGNVTSAIEASASRQWFDDFNRQDIAPNAYIDGNMFLDVRLPFDMKTFGNFEAQYLPDSSKAYFHLRELFVDANFNKLVYVRTGKQIGRAHV
jgi:hypothetical protein